MEDIGKIITSVATVLVAIIGLIIKSKEKKTARATFEPRFGKTDAEDLGVSDRARKPELPEEGVKLFAEKKSSESTGGETGKEKKVRIDKRNLVIYSELMKPKFD